MAALLLASAWSVHAADPKEPSAANHWISTGPHVMVVGAEPSFYDAYPKGAEPDTSSPYIMWAGTPYQHLMAPGK